MDQNLTPYADAIAAYSHRGYAKFATPGFQVASSAQQSTAQPELVELFGRALLAGDVQPLIEGIDHGPYPTPLDKSLELAADAWGARRTWFLANGASMGNLTACLAIRNFGTNIVVQRSMHSSVIDGLAITGLVANFVQPSVDIELGIANGVSVQDLTEALQNTQDPVAAYVITPSYFGAVADVAGLAKVAHSFNVPLIVDEAWGSHFGFHNQLPTNAIRLGADLVISSTHKLGGSLSQTAMLHLGHGSFADELEPFVERAFRSMQSTSVNSLLLVSLDLARKQLAVNGKTTITQSLAGANAIRAGIKAANRFTDAGDQLKNHPDVYEIDPLRIAINTAVGKISGYEARSILFNEFAVHCEMATESTLVALIGAGATPEVDRLLTGLANLPIRELNRTDQLLLPTAGDRQMSVRDAYFSKTEVIPASATIGRVSADSLAAYPPGIPNILPGEIITAENIHFLQATIRAPFGHVRGGASKDMTAFRVVT
jgi:lysine decarboxylase